MLLYLDGLPAEEDMTVKSILVDSDPTIHIFSDVETKDVVLCFQDYSVYSSYPLSATVDLIIKGFNSVFSIIEIEL